MIEEFFVIRVNDKPNFATRAGHKNLIPLLRTKKTLNWRHTGKVFCLFMTLQMAFFQRHSKLKLHSIKEWKESKLLTSNVRNYDQSNYSHYDHHLKLHKNVNQSINHFAEIVSALTFKFCNQNFRLSLPACCSNCDAPCCRASALSSNSDSFWSRSNTFSTFVFIISTTYERERYFWR